MSGRESESTGLRLEPRMEAARAKVSILGGENIGAKEGSELFLMQQQSASEQ